MPADQISDKASLLSSSWLLKELRAEEISRLARYARTAQYRRNQTIFEKGDPGTNMMVVNEGQVKIRSISWDGKEVVFNIIDHSEMFGEVAMIDGLGRTADAVAMVDTEVIVIERRDFVPLVDRYPQIGAKLLSVLCERLRRTSEQVEDLLFLVQSMRLAKTLLRLADEYGHPSGPGISIDLRMSQRDLGSLVGMRREAMNRQLGAWREEGLLTLQDRIITLNDVAAFRQYLDTLIE